MSLIYYKIGIFLYTFRIVPLFMGHVLFKKIISTPARTQIYSI
jgi:hypothetical protein